MIKKCIDELFGFEALNKYLIYVKVKIHQLDSISKNVNLMYLNFV